MKEVQRVDDRRHSLLSKAHRPSQAALDAFSGDAPMLPRDGYGAVAVEEVEVRSALTLCQIGDRPWSINPYAGCAHGCAYCYVPDVAHVERPRWGSYVVVKRNLASVLARELKRKERRPVFLSSATDPYQPAEAEHGLTRRCLELLLRVDWPLTVLTRSPLVTRDIDLLSRFSDVSVGLSVPTLDEEARRVIEPAAPAIPARLAALRELAEAGLETFANLAPCYPLTGGVTPGLMARTFRDANVGSVAAGTWRYLTGVLPALRGRVDGTRYAAFVEAVQDKRHFERLFASLEVAFEREGPPFRVMGASGRRHEPSMRASEQAASLGSPGISSAHQAPL